MSGSAGLNLFFSKVPTSSPELPPHACLSQQQYDEYSCHTSITAMSPVYSSSLRMYLLVLVLVLLRYALLPRAAEKTPVSLFHDSRRRLVLVIGQYK